ncbi:RING-H2 finger protein ATL2 [Hibiscus syriacus]|uniref:RING-H2 finger protein ATL2 n=1 Tax=Hibiscus syriacus TaxID=106335 RepID=A0A6A2WIQ5_HIBSY|nr:RING-H2 finger protein ATL2 [Hibiscus syriacus]
MLGAIVVLFFVVVLMFALHIYARWYLIRARRRNSRNRRRRRSQLVFYVDNDATPPTSRGLDARVLKSLPVFTYSSETHPSSVLECAVCLSEFEEDESGRHEDGQPVSSAVRLGRKLLIEVPIEGFVGESTGCDSWPSQSYKSPMSRMLSFTRMLSRDSRGSRTSPCP